MAVSSALEDLTAEFGMGSGVAPPLEPPGNEKDLNEIFSISWLSISQSSAKLRKLKQDKTDKVKN